MILDAFQDPSEPRFRINAVEFAGLNQSIGDGGGFTARFRAHEEIILTAQRHRPDGAFGGVIVQLQEAVIQ